MKFKTQNHKIHKLILSTYFIVQKSIMIDMCFIFNTFVIEFSKIFSEVITCSFF